MENIYNGNIVTDAAGRATVQLPDYFSSINKDFKYQLTIIDENQFAMARISKKINGNKFEIRTDKPNIEVSWQVTAVRNDKAAQEFVTPAVTEKKANEKGKYLNPELYNQPKEKGIHYTNNAKILQQKQLESTIPVTINNPVTEQKQIPPVATEEMAAKEKGKN